MISLKVIEPVNVGFALSTIELPASPVAVAANVLLTPSYPFVFVAGMVFGVWWGPVLSLIAQTISATINFFLGGKIGRSYYRKRSKNRRIELIKRYNKYNQHNFFT